MQSALLSFFSFFFSGFLFFFPLSGDCNGYVDLKVKVPWGRGLKTKFQFTEGKVNLRC